MADDGPANDYDQGPAILALWAASYDAVLSWAEMTLGQAQRLAPNAEGTLEGAGTIQERSVPEPGGMVPSQILPVTAEGVRGASLPTSARASVSEREIPTPHTGMYAEVWIVFPLIYSAFQHRGKRFDGTHVILNRPAGGQSDYLSQPFKQNMRLLPVAIQMAQKKVGL